VSELTGDLLDWAMGHYYYSDRESLARTYTSRGWSKDGAEGARQLWAKVFDGDDISTKHPYPEIMQRLKDEHDLQGTQRARQGINKVLKCGTAEAYEVSISDAW
jgi:hypothetical protein